VRSADVRQRPPAGFAGGRRRSKIAVTSDVYEDLASDGLAPDFV
jgi:hypothetical protein